LDYGSGHELSFACWLACLERLGLLDLGRDAPALGLRALARYLAAARRFQAAYYLEPAGAHRVWGLDDFQVLPLLVSSPRVVGRPSATPRAVRSELAIEELAPEYMYLGQVAHAVSCKTGGLRGLRWHSPLLDDISSARDWAKVEAGMRRMFLAEVLGKLPV